jgi:flagellar hook-associated protein 3 FlgL
MRITNNIIHRTSLATVQQNLRQIHASQGRVSTGLRLQKASDDPVGAMESMRARGSLRALDQYRKAIQTATSRAAAEETALDQLGNTLVRARELALAYAGDTANADGRRVGKAEVDQLLRQAIGLANTSHQDAYIFGGTGGAQPFQVIEGPSLDYSSSGARGELEVEISNQHRVAVNHNGTEVFEETGALSALRDLARALGQNDVQGIRGAEKRLQESFESVQRIIGTVGSRTNLLQVTSANLDALDINLRTLKSEVEEVDIEQAITELVNRQTTYQAALLATTRVMGLSLADYLR